MYAGQVVERAPVRRAVPLSAASLHGRAPRRPAAARAAPPAPCGDRGHGAEHDRAAAGLPLPGALPVSHPEMRRDAAARSGRRRPPLPLLARAAGEVGGVIANAALSPLDSAAAHPIVGAQSEHPTAAGKPRRGFDSVRARTPVADDAPVFAPYLQPRVPPRAGRSAPPLPQGREASTQHDVLVPGRRSRQALRRQALGARAAARHREGGRRRVLRARRPARRWRSSASPAAASRRSGGW